MKRILLVEDEDIIRIGLREMIRSIGGWLVIAEASRGDEALRQVGRHAPDLIITDIRMPGGDGLKFIEHLRLANPNLPVIVVSGFGEFHYAQSAIRLGVSDFLLKPVSRTDLARALYEHRDTSQPEAGHPRHPMIARVEAYVEAHLDGDLSLGAVTRQVHLNPQYLSSLFKRETGQNYLDYVTKRRMQRARELLDRSSLHIYEIATLVGYQSPKHFMTVFKQMTGTTASAWRARVGEESSE